VPSIEIPLLHNAWRLSNITAGQPSNRPPKRQLFCGDIGSIRIGCSSLSTSAKHANARLALISIAQEPQISSNNSVVGNRRGFSAVGRVTGFPSAMGSVAQANDDVHRRPPLERKLFQRAVPSSGLPFHLTITCFFSHNSSPSNCLPATPTRSLSYLPARRNAAAAA